MLVDDKYYTAAWYHDASDCLKIIDQRYLPWKFIINDINNSNQIFTAIKDMLVRGAPLIGTVAAFGAYFAVNEAKSKKEYQKIIDKLKSSRPTAVNLFHALNYVNNFIDFNKSKKENIISSLSAAKKYRKINNNDCKKIGNYGIDLVEKISKKKKRKINILTHCNAGWLACGDFGTATAPIYAAYDKGIDLHVWVDETRPRNQGARLTAWELMKHGVNCTVIPDNTGGHLMQNNLVDMVIVGSDRTTKNGDVANKIGTYLKALAAHDNDIPFYVALPSSTIDPENDTVPIEQRSENEVKYIEGFYNNDIQEVMLTPKESKAANFGFDITPAQYVSKLITEKGLCNADNKSIQELLKK